MLARARRASADPNDIRGSHFLIPRRVSMKAIGYDRPLFVQPFDHRGSFTKGFFGIEGEPQIAADREEFLQVARAKTLVYQGLLKAIELGVDAGSVGILVDTQFGAHIIADARSKGIPVSICVEKTGKKVFDFEYGARWVDHIRFMRPDIIKVLVRLHPADDAAANAEQMTRLKLLSDYIHATEDHHLMFELLVPATTDEEKAAGAAYDLELRPKAMMAAIEMLQRFGVEPDIWKIEGLDRREDAQAVAEVARAGKAADGQSRGDVGCILLGRGSDKEQVYKWLEVAAPLPGYIGFAVGRTNFSAPLKRAIADPSQEQASIEEIGRNYKGCIDVWRAAGGR
jgi:myo-inositol catabolism protein IolC